MPADLAAPGTPLTLGKGPGGTLDLSWSPSCTGTPTNYAVYEGTLPLAGSYTHAPLNCSLGNTTTPNIIPGAGSRYYLLVAETAWNDGLSGMSKIGGVGYLIPATAGVCHLQLVSSCPAAICVGADPSTGHCTSSSDCGVVGGCDFLGCTPSGCICDDTGTWVCKNDCLGHCI